MMVISFLFGLRESRVLHIKMGDLRGQKERKYEVLVRFLKIITSDEAMIRDVRVYEASLSCGNEICGDERTGVLTAVLTTVNKLLVPVALIEGWR